METARKDDKKGKPKQSFDGSIKGVCVDIHPSVKIGKNSFVWSFAVICEGVEIGDNCVVGSGVYIGRYTKIGNGVRIQDKVHLTDHMVIEDNVFIGPGAVTMNDKYPVANNPDYKCCPPYFEEGCSVGAGVVILPGVRIGKWAMIAAGAVVTKDISPKTVAVGHPAIEKAWVKDSSEK